MGYWIASDNPAGTERIAGVGYDYVCVDGQHGLLDYSGWLAALTAIDSRHRAAGLVRVPSSDPFWIGRALDAGAYGVIVPLVNTAEEAARAVQACRYPPDGVRSFGPSRSSLRVGPDAATANRSVSCLVMIETAEGLRNLDEICAVPGLDGLYIGPSDLTLALGGCRLGDPAVQDSFDRALDRILAVAERAGITCAMHCASGELAATRLNQGFTMVTISNDLAHLEQAAAAHLRSARGDT